MRVRTDVDIASTISVSWMQLLMWLREKVDAGVGGGGGGESLQTGAGGEHMALATRSNQSGICRAKMPRAMTMRIFHCVVLIPHNIQGVGCGDVDTQGVRSGRIAPISPHGAHKRSKRRIKKEGEVVAWNDCQTYLPGPSELLPYDVICHARVVVVAAPYL